jgi:hypothetical protein
MPNENNSTPEAGQATGLSVATGSADDADLLTICVARDMITKLKADVAHFRKRFEWWMDNADAIAKERAELFRAGEAMRAAFVASMGAEGKCDRVAKWDEAAQPMRDMIEWMSSPNTKVTQMHSEDGASNPPSA